MRTSLTTVARILVLVALVGPLEALGQTVNVTADISVDTEWTADNTYILDGLIFVNDGATLTIQAGTVIKALEAQNITTGDDASALIIRRGGKINANGTEDAPIIFTTELDDVANPNDLDQRDRGLWGGVILLGKATTNQPTTENQIEGIPTEINALYGGSDDDDSSGSMSYVSIRHGGFSISGVEGDEINGLTFGAAGRGTDIHHIEVFANFDDGYEWFGGTVEAKYLVAAFVGDDAYDYDQGYRGKGQFWFSIHDTDIAGRGGEHDGGDDGGDDATPLSTPTISNVTYVGSGASAAVAGGDNNDYTFAIRDNAGGYYYNSIFTDFPGGALNIEDLGSGADSRERLEQGDLAFNTNIWFGFGAGSTLADIVEGDFAETILGNAANTIEDPLLAGISRTADGGLDPRLLENSPARSGAMEMADDFFTPVEYLGAFGKSNWLLGWTATDELGFAGELVPGSDVVVSTDISATTTWTNNNTYFLDGLIFVNDGATLNIEAGTVIKGLEENSISTGDGASALIIRRGGKIMANGSDTDPIIFTSELDDVADPGDLDQRDRGLWGGLIILGKATTNQPTEDNQIEGIPTEIDALYGGSNDADDSGELSYVSIRHGGFSISGVEGDEINGLTFGAVGSETDVHHIEVYANFDDCYEWFGGTVNAKYLVGAFCGDDSFDYDQGFRGKGQYWFSIHDTDIAGRGGEHDGGDDGGDDATPYSIPVISNVTYIGAGASAIVAGGDNNDYTFAIRDNAGGQYWNSIFTDYPGKALNIEDLGSGEDSANRLVTGDLVFQTNLWFGFGGGSTLDELVEGTFAETILAGTGNTLADPQLAGISRTTDGGLDPRPLASSPAHSGAMDVGDDWFDDVVYLGAFQHELWINGWTAIDEAGFTGDLRVAVEEIDSAVPQSLVLCQNYPNPFRQATSVEFQTPEAGAVRLAVYDVLGREVAVLVDEDVASGTHRVSFDASDLSAGIYLYRIETERGVQSRTMTLVK